GRARVVAAQMLEAAADDIAFHEGALIVRGVPARRVSLADVASRARELGEPLAANCVFDQPDAAYPSDGYAASGWSKTQFAASGSPSSRARDATSARLTRRAGTPRTISAPSWNAMSSAAASSICAATTRAR